MQKKLGRGSVIAPMNIQPIVSFAGKTTGKVIEGSMRDGIAAALVSVGVLVLRWMVLRIPESSHCRRDIHGCTDRKTV
jgi:hypothetical protein